MLDRALSLATVMLLVGCFAERALAQENLDAGKTPSQIFAGTCNACHRSPRGLLKTVPPGSLSSFLRQHYTTSPNMAGVLANYLISNGATDTRMPKEGAKDARQEAKQDARPAAGPDQGDRRRQRPTGASQEPRPEPSAKPDETEVPAAAMDHGAKSSAKQKFSKRGREEPPKADAAPAGESAAREEPKAEPAKPSGEASQSAKVEPSGDPLATRPDPVPPVTPAPAAATPMAAPPGTPPTFSPEAVSAAVAGTASEAAPAVPLPSSPAPAVAPAVTATAPALPPVAPAGPPAPPISQ